MTKNREKELQKLFDLMFEDTLLLIESLHKKTSENKTLLAGCIMSICAKYIHDNDSKNTACIMTQQVADQAKKLPDLSCLAEVIACVNSHKR